MPRRRGGARGCLSNLPMRIFSTAASVARRGLSTWRAAWNWLLGPVAECNCVSQPLQSLTIEVTGRPKLSVQCPLCNKLGCIPGGAANWVIVLIPNQVGRAYCPDCGPHPGLPKDEYRRRTKRASRWELRYAHAASN